MPEYNDLVVRVFLDARKGTPHAPKSPAPTPTRSLETRLALDSPDDPSRAAPGIDMTPGRRRGRLRVHPSRHQAQAAAARAYRARVRAVRRVTTSPEPTPSPGLGRRPTRPIAP